MSDLYLIIAYLILGWVWAWRLASSDDINLD